MRKIGIAMITLPAVSGFLWAAFDVSWWTQATDGSGREVSLVILHGALAYFGFWFVVTGDEE